MLQTDITERSDEGLAEQASLSPRLADILAKNGYTDICVLRRQVCAVRGFNFTTAVVVGLDDVGYERRYCYEHRSDAQVALAIWDGVGHPSGPWIKCKGAGIDLLNPQFG
jgi:hypothetical protein